MNIKSIAVGSVAILVSLGVLTGCGSSSSTETAAPVSATSAATAPAEAPAPAETTPAPEPLSDIEAAVQTFVAALDDLGIEHSEPVRADVLGSGAKAGFDMTVNGYDAGINVFGDAETLATWQELSDAFGGIHVAFGNSVLTLNSSEGIADSAEIAPKIAKAIGGEARGV